MTTFHELADSAPRMQVPQRHAAVRHDDADDRRSFARMIVSGDLLTVMVSTGVAALLQLSGTTAADRAALFCGAISAALLIASLWLTRSWDPAILGQGSAEFTRLGRAVVTADVVLAFGGLSLMVHSVRPWVFGIVPLTGLLCLGSRFLLRKWLHARRRSGHRMAAVLAVGSEPAVADLVRRTRRDPHFGWTVTGVCTPAGTGVVDDVPVVGDLDSVSELAHQHGHNVVAVCQAPGWGPARLHRLAWQLEDTNAELTVDPGLMEIAGPRMHINPVDGFPLLHLSRPRFTGVARVAKTVMDRVLAGVLLVAFAPVMIGLALAVKLCDGGPIFFRQERIGARGAAFRMLKFRSMCVDAEQHLAGLATNDNDGAGPLFKLRLDPRVTRIGRVLRKYSLDELPQLFNVLAGTMSLVGPRPPLPREVATYADDARRRLLVRPGMTGLWQVSGRSSLSWEETVRLDLRYVENWSVALDLTILWKTFGAVFGGRGAY